MSSLSEMSFIAHGSSSATRWDPEARVFGWEEKHLRWAQATAGVYFGDVSFFARFLTAPALTPEEQERLTKADFRFDQPIHAWAPIWLHAAWDLATEVRSIVREDPEKRDLTGARRSLTSKQEDKQMMENCVFSVEHDSDLVWVKAVETIYFTPGAGLIALAEFARSSLASENPPRGEPTKKARRWMSLGPKKGE